jgi:hypothetical protein
VLAAPAPARSAPAAPDRQQDGPREGDEHRHRDGQEDALDAVVLRKGVGGEGQMRATYPDGARSDPGV